MTRVNTVALGAYLTALRKLNRLSRAKVAELVGTVDPQILRIEKGDQETRGSLLFKILRAVNGDNEDAEQIFTRTDMTVEEAQALARARWEQRQKLQSPRRRERRQPRLVGEKRFRAEEMIRKLSPDDRALFERWMDAIIESPEEGQYWLGFLRGISTPHPEGEQ